MSHLIENDILVRCNDCKEDLKRKIKDKTKFKIKKFRDTSEQSKKERN